MYLQLKERFHAIVHCNPAQLTLPKADDVRAGSCLQDEVVQTPVTPVSVDALTSLHNLIEQDARTLDGTGIQRLRRHVRKLVHAT